LESFLRPLGESYFRQHCRNIDEENLQETLTADHPPASDETLLAVVEAVAAHGLREDCEYMVEFSVTGFEMGTVD
jgi:hypothetical protein